MLIYFLFVLIYDQNIDIGKYIDEQFKIHTRWMGRRVKQRTN